MTSAIRRINDTRLEVTVELGASDLQEFVAKAEQRLAQGMDLDGFRSGKVPPEIVRQRISPDKLRQEALQLAVSESLDQTVEQEHLDVLDQKDFAVRENTPDKLRYTITLILYPRITLGAYKGIAVQKKSETVTDQEVDSVLADIVVSRTPKGGKASELNDDFAKSLGAFSSLENLKTVVWQGLTVEKADRERDRVRIALINAVIVNSQLVIPPEMIERQLDSMIQGFDRELHAQGMELGPYLAHIKKTQDQLRDEWRPKAEQNLNVALTLHAIGKAERITVDAREVQKQLELAYTRDQSVDIDRARNAIASALLNNKIFEFLETHAILTS